MKKLILYYYEIESKVENMLGISYIIFFGYASQHYTFVSARSYIKSNVVNDCFHRCKSFTTRTKVSYGDSRARPVIGGQSQGVEWAKGTKRGK